MTETINEIDEIEKGIEELDERMRADGIKPDENGQWNFADCVFYDVTMSVEQRIGLLELSDDGDPDKKSKGYIERLKTQLAEETENVANCG